MTLAISVDVRQLHPGEIRVVHGGGMPGRLAADFGGPAAGRWWPLVRDVLGAGDLLQRDPDCLHHPEAAQAQQGSDGIQFRLQDGVQDDQEVGRRGALREPVRRYVTLPLALKIVDNLARWNRNLHQLVTVSKTIERSLSIFLQLDLVSAFFFFFRLVTKRASSGFF